MSRGSRTSAAEEGPPPLWQVDPIGEAMKLEDDGEPANPERFGNAARSVLSDIRSREAICARRDVEETPEQEVVVEAAPEEAPAVVELVEPSLPAVSEPVPSPESVVECKPKRPASRRKRSESDAVPLRNRGELRRPDVVRTLRVEVDDVNAAQALVDALNSGAAAELSYSGAGWTLRVSGGNS